MKFFSVKRSNCFVVWCGDLPQQFNSIGGPQPAHSGMSGTLVTCTVDIATGLLTFSANGKDLNTYYQVILLYDFSFSYFSQKKMGFLKFLNAKVEPRVLLYPAVFAMPTSANVFQYELGRSKVMLRFFFHYNYFIIFVLHFILQFIYIYKYIMVFAFCFNHFV